MTPAGPIDAHRVLAVLRRLLLAALVAGIVGTAGELLLLGHFETGAAPRVASVRALQLATRR